MSDFIGGAIAVQNNWKECKLGDIAEIKGGKRLPKGELLVTEKTPHPYIRITDFDGHKINLSAIQYVTEEVQKSISRYIVNKQDIIISNVGTIGLCAKIPDELDNANLTENCIKLVFDKNKIDTNFLYYHLISPDTQDLISGFDVGSTQPKLPIYNIEKIDISLPPLEEQKAIAEVLSSFDDKIDLLHRQNQTLESLAQTLFRQWFIEEAKEEWEEIKLGDFVDCITGYSYKSDHLNDSNNALVTLKNFARDGSFRLDGFKEFTGTKYKDSQIVKHGDLVVSHTDITQEADIIGNPVLVVDMGRYDNLIITMDLMKVESKVDWLSKEFLYYLFRTEDFKFHCLGNSNGTTVLHMSRKTIPEYKIKIPNIKRIEDFTNDVKEILQKQYVNILQIQTLENLRDTLLPKLLSGEVRI